MAFAVAAFAAACSPAEPGGSGLVRLRIAASPDPAATNVTLRITLRGVYLIPKGPADASSVEMRGGPVSVPGDVEIDLADLRDGRTALLASERVPAGDYSGVRLVFAGAAVVRSAGGPREPLAVTAVGLDGETVDVPSFFTLRDGESVDVTLGVDTEASARGLESGGDRRIVVREARPSVARTAD